jgi:3-mercaptopyruvate sulfurtransferase SseA
MMKDKLMAEKPNSLQAVLERKKTEQEPKPIVDARPKERPEGKSTPRKKENKPSRGGTTLIGGHFPPRVARQLGIIAAEEGATKQALLTEALDMLFVKKGKARIAEL